MAARFDENDAECLVFTYKEGLLSKLAHDLKLRVTRFRGEVAEGPLRVSASFDAGSLRVLCAVRDGIEDLLGAADRRKIEETIRDEVLHSRAHPQVRFESTAVRAEGEGFRIEGTLRIRERERAVACITRLLDGRQVAELRLHQPDFGIRPYSTMLGTLKIRPDVLVRLAVPDKALAALRTP